MPLSSQPLSPLALAIENNAQWCSLVWQSHDLPVVQPDGWVACPAPVPDFYPNLVTTADEQARLLAAIEDLRAQMAGKAFSLKDSFGNLPLENLGMTCLFSASWLHLPAGREISSAEKLIWRTAATAEDLAHWEGTWDEREAGADRIFLPALLEAEGVAFWGGWSEGELKAGFVANVTGQVVGISNTFGAYDSTIAQAQALAHYRGKDLVTYEADGQLAEPLALGFEKLGSLKIWIS
ncbi:hypothetical protein ACTL6U_18735 [Rhodovibrionaceae bacterium A322]